MPTFGRFRFLLAMFGQDHESVEMFGKCQKICRGKSVKFVPVLSARGCDYYQLPVPVIRC